MCRFGGRSCGRSRIGGCPVCRKRDIWVRRCKKGKEKEEEGDVTMEMFFAIIF